MVYKTSVWGAHAQVWPETALMVLQVLLVAWWGLPPGPGSCPHMLVIASHIS